MSEYFVYLGKYSVITEIISVIGKGNFWKVNAPKLGFERKEYSYSRMSHIIRQ